jgi:hypothetical protein
MDARLTSLASSIRSLVIFFGPILLPKAIAYYQSIRQQSRLQKLAIRPAPQNVQIALGVLSLLTLTYLVSTLPPFAPENLFHLTESRLQIPVDVLFNRVASVRPSNALTAADQALRARFVNLESRLLYLQYGPAALAECPFCVAEEPRSYFYYALPDITWPHLLNLVAVAVVTSPTWTGRHGGQWRTLATIAAGVLGALEVYFVSSYNHQANSRSLRLAELDMFHWSMRTYRLVALAALDAGLAWVLWLSSTNRAFATPPSPAERVEMANRGLMGVKSKITALGIVRNTTMRDEELRARLQGYWAHEVRTMNEIMQDREVVDGVNDALSQRIRIQDITNDAELYAQSVTQPARSSAAEKSE